MDPQKMGKKQWIHRKWEKNNGSTENGKKTKWIHRKWEKNKMDPQKMGKKQNGST